MEDKLALALRKLLQRVETLAELGQSLGCVSRSFNGVSRVFPNIPALSIGFSVLALQESFLNAVPAAKGEGLASPAVCCFLHTCAAPVPLCVGIRNKTLHVGSVFE